MSGSSPLPRKKRRWLRRLLIIFGILGVAVYFVFRDDELLPVDDLMPKRQAIAWDDNNGWKCFLTFIEGTPKAPSSARRQINEVIDLEREPDAAETAKYTLTAKQLTELEAIAAMPRFQAEFHVGPEDAYVSYYALLELQHRFNCTLVSAAGDTSIPLFLRCLRLSTALQRKFTGGAVALHEYIAGLKLVSDAAIARALVRLDWTGADLNAMADILAGDPVILDEVQEALRGGFRLRYQEILNPDGPFQEYDPRWVRYLFQKNRTANQLAKITRENLDIALVVVWPVVQSRWETMKSKRDSLVYWLDPNWYGRRFLYGFDSGYWDGRNLNARRRGMQVIVALHRFQKARGSLPAKLDELVPEFLPAIPLDPFDFEPLRWDAAKRTVRWTSRDGFLVAPKAKQAALISADESSILFRTKAEEEARRASLPPPKPARPLPKKSGMPAQASGTP